MAIASVIVDSRENWTQGLRFGGAPVSVDLIDTDILLLLDSGDLLGFERSTSDDFLGKIRSDRLFPQLAKLRELTPWAYLIITGELRPGPAGKCLSDRGETGWNWSSVQGALLSVQEIGVHVTFCAEVDFEQTVIRLANRDRGTVRVQPARDVSSISEGEAILTSLPGIGEDKATSALAYCGSAAWALTALTMQHDTPVPGVGSGIVRKIRRALGLLDGEVLHVVYEANGNPVEKVSVPNG